ncbi:protein LTO1 homolog isoform X2 [Saimiri boliviensis]|uniref:protein LTO1 homolog isoform X2 n=1 Tax=Saimiri boliviensis TaxID=27679 RepID=UPI003D776B8B
MAGSQDMFDAIVMADERFHGEGYREGYEEGSSLGVMEGRQHGSLQGARIGSEIGCYQGFAFAWKCLLHSCTAEKDSRKMKVLESLIGMIQKFPYDDPTYDKLHEDLDKIRGKFKQWQEKNEKIRNREREACVLSGCWRPALSPMTHRSWRRGYRPHFAETGGPAEDKSSGHRVTLLLDSHSLFPPPWKTALLPSAMMVRPLQLRRTVSLLNLFFFINYTLPSVGYVFYFILFYFI